MDPLLISVEEAAKALGVNRSTTYELLAAGELPRVKVGRRTLVPVRALSVWVDRKLLASRMAYSDARITRNARKSSVYQRIAKPLTARTAPAGPAGPAPTRSKAE
jgi:excisionase family DNA binding protein